MPNILEGRVEFRLKLVTTTKTITTTTTKSLQSSEREKKKKQRIDEHHRSGGESPSSCRLDKNNKDDDGDIHNYEDNKAEHQTSTPEAGYYLVVFSNKKNKLLLSPSQQQQTQQQEYLLSFPHALNKIICDAARFKETTIVRVSKYTIIPLQLTTTTDSNSTTVADTSNNKKKRKRPESSKSPQRRRLLLMLEIQKDGIEIVVSNNSIHLENPSTNNSFLSLQQIHDEEEICSKSNNKNLEIIQNSNSNNINDKKEKRSSSRSRSRRRYYDIKGRVDSISPIITVVMEEPFALIELYDDEDNNSTNNNYSCVVVIKGMTSLCCHSGIFPGDMIYLRGVKRQRWKIPEELMTKRDSNLPPQYLIDRVPTHVFVLNKDSSSIVWKNQNQRILNRNTVETTTRAATTTTTTTTVFPPLPSTPIPLYSLQGRIVSREWASRGSTNVVEEEEGRGSSLYHHQRSCYLLHSVDLELLVDDDQEEEEEETAADGNAQQQQQRHTLFLTYYPMLPYLTMSLRRGAIIRAVNIHCIGFSKSVVDVDMGGGGGGGDSSSSSGSSNKTRTTTITTYFYGLCLRSTITILQMPPITPPPPPLPLPSSLSSNHNTMMTTMMNCSSKKTSISRIDDDGNDINRNDDENERNSSLLQYYDYYYPYRPLAFLTVQRTCIEYACRQTLYRWYYDQGNFITTTTTTKKQQLQQQQQSSPLLFDDIAKAWWEHHQCQIQKQNPVLSSPPPPPPPMMVRNPYVEFFDHAHHGGGGGDDDDEGTETTEKFGGCHCNNNNNFTTTPTRRRGFQIKRLPDWIALDKLRGYGIGILQKRLDNMIVVGQQMGKKKTTTTTKGGGGSLLSQIGWTGSIHLSQSDILRDLLLVGEEGDAEEAGHDAIIYTGGIVVGGSGVGREEEFTNSTGLNTHLQQQQLASALLANDHCRIPGTTVKDQLIPESSETGEEEHGTDRLLKATFAFGQLEGIVASSICLGASLEVTAPLEKNENENEGSNMPLPPNECCTTLVAKNDDARNNLSDHTRGACSLFTCRGQLFLLSIQLKFKTLVPVFPSGTSCTSLSGNESSHLKAATTASKVPKDPSSCPHQEEKAPYFNHQWRTIQQCLDPESRDGSKQHQGGILGLLVRHRFRQSRIVDNRYRGFVFTLSHIPINQKDELEEEPIMKSISTLQTIEVKTSIHHKNLQAKRSYLQRAITKLMPATSFSLDDAINLALSFWQIADNATICPLSAGGWDDCLPSTPAFHPYHPEKIETTSGVVVELHRHVAHERDPRGYQRFACSTDLICARFIRLVIPESTLMMRSQSRESVAESTRMKTLCFMGGSKFLPGHLDRRPLRRTRRDHHSTPQANSQTSTQTSLHLNLDKGELMTLGPQTCSGIPECSLADMLRYVCLDLKNQQGPANTSNNQQRSTASFIAPSLVRKLAGARLLGISFCQVQVTCSKCFQPLFHSEANKNDTEDRRRGHQRGKGWGGDDQQRQKPSFWHCPLPIPGTPQVKESKRKETSSADAASINDTAAASVDVQTTSMTLCCPNGCHSAQSHAETKWECSGIVDDGTGQAKLYAERDAAVMLLGMDQATVDSIEQGAYHSKKCSIVFSKTVPPPSHLAKAVEAANFKYSAQEKIRMRSRRSLKQFNSNSVATTTTTNNNNNKSGDEKQRILEMLDPVDRAVYLMYQHCRYNSQATTRRLDYLVRCKPLSDKVVHLNHTEVDLVSPGMREGTPSSHKVATYSLPPLKLNLVDCCNPRTLSNNDVVEETWDLIRSMQ